MLRGLRAAAPQVRAWYCYAFAAEVFSACALAIFLPITLEHIARDVGFLAPDLTVPCSNATSEGETDFVCKARIAGVWLDTASFSMYVKSMAVAAQALCIISIGPLADQACWRKRILLLCAAGGAASGILFFLLPSSPLPAAILTIVGNACYATSIVCANAFLPSLAREDPSVRAAAATLVSSSAGPFVDRTDGPSSLPARSFEEARALLGEPLPHSVVAAISPVDLAKTPSSPIPTDANEQYTTLLSLTTSRLSSAGTALGFLSGVSVLTLLTVPVTLLGGSTFSLKLAIGISALWWGLFTIPAGLGLPGGIAPATSSGMLADRTWLGTAWRRVGRMVTRAEIRKLPNLFTFLLAWIFLSDGFHTTTYTAILYASSTLGMSAGKIILIGILVQLSAVVSSIFVPRLQDRLAYSNHRLLLGLVLAGEVIPVYACLGLILPFGGLRTEAEMYVAAVWFGLLYGPFNSYSRAVYAELIPPGHESTFFSLFSLTDKSASFFGPLVVGIIADVTGNIRLGFMFLLLMLALPVPVLLRVHVGQGRVEGRAWADEHGAAAELSGEGVALLHAS